jgi:glycosyltransferase involved in cell wall biosynthesis
MTPLLSVIVPAYNEATRLGASLRVILAYLSAAPEAELIVVDDGSTDETCRIAVETLRAEGVERARVISGGVNRGKGYAVRLGLLAARAPIAVFSDADLSTPITELPKLVRPIEQGECDLTFGSRALDRSLIEVHQPRLREFGGRVFNGVLRVATGLPFSDTQCGFKAFRMAACRPILEAARIDRFGFDVELLYVAHRAGLRLREVPVRWSHCDGSKVSVLRDSVRMLQEVGLVRWHAATGGYARAGSYPMNGVPTGIAPSVEQALAKAIAAAPRSRER